MASCLTLKTFLSVIIFVFIDACLQSRVVQLKTHVHLCMSFILFHTELAQICCCLQCIKCFPVDEFCQQIQDLERGLVTSFPAPPFPSFFSFLPPFSLSSTPLPLPPLPVPFQPSSPFHFLSLPPILLSPWGPSPFPARWPGERCKLPSGRCKLPQRGPGQSPGRKSNFGISGAQKRAWWQAFSSFFVKQNAYGGPCIMRSSAPVTDMKFDLQKL